MALKRHGGNLLRTPASVLAKTCDCGFYCPTPIAQLQLDVSGIEASGGAPTGWSTVCPEFNGTFIADALGLVSSGFYCGWASEVAVTAGYYATGSGFSAGWLYLTGEGFWEVYYQTNYPGNWTLEAVAYALCDTGASAPPWGVGSPNTCGFTGSNAIAIGSTSVNRATYNCATKPPISLSPLALGHCNGTVSVTVTPL